MSAVGAPIMQHDNTHPARGGAPDAGDPMFVHLPAWWEVQKSAAFKDQLMAPPPGLSLNRDSGSNQRKPVMGDMFLKCTHAIDPRSHVSSTSTIATAVEDAAVFLPLGPGFDQDLNVEADGLPETIFAAVIDDRDEQADDAEVWPKTLVTSAKAKNKSYQKGKEASTDLGAPVRWWTQPHLPLLCPITCFPICYLPYPPFKLRTDPKRSNPHRLVDGKYLAMQVIVTNRRFFVCGRMLEASDLKALDDYIYRCKLGPFRPGREALLAKAVADAISPEARRQAVEKHARFLSDARAELGKLRRIQENRLLQTTAVPPTRCYAKQPGPQPRHQRMLSGGQLHDLQLP
mmetsp:Transcript_17932/g.35019  ORF Transcript_17932/g.35019 Transcript_17932/m.35019 type:complete len:345 (+) Transcript_17932:70-1104(+)